MIRLNDKKRRVLLFFLLSYIIILLIPMMMTAYTYKYTLDLMEDEVKAKYTTLLDLCRNVIDVRFKEIDKLVDSLMLSKEVQKMMYLKNYTRQKSNIYDIYTFQQYISTHNTNNDFIKAFYLYFNYSDMVVSPFDTYLTYERFYNFFKYKNMSHEEWKKLMLSCKLSRTYLPSAPVFINNGYQQTTENRILLIQPLYSYGTDVKGCILIMVFNEDDMLGMLNEVNRQAEGYSYILDNNGRIMATTDKGNKLDINLVKQAIDNEISIFNVNGQNMYAFGVKSDYNGWMYISIVNQKALMKEINHIRDFYLYGIIICFVLGMSVAFSLAYRSSKPIGEVVSNLENTVGDHNKGKIRSILNYMCNSINILIENNINLSKSMEEQIPKLRSSFISSVINGEQIEGNINKLLTEQLKFDFKYNGFIALIAKIVSQVQFDKQNNIACLYADKLNVRHELKVAFGEDRVYDIDIDKLLVIYNCEDNAKEQEAVEKIINDLAKKINRQYGIRIAVGIGKYVDSFSYFHETYSTAKYALEYKLYDNSNYVMRYSDIPDDTNSYYYPLELETRLINYARAGEIEQAESLIDLIYNMNIEERKLSPEKLRFLIYNMCCTILRVIQTINAGKEYEKSIEERIKTCESLFSVKEQFDTIKSLYRDISEFVINRRRSNNRKFIEEIQKYLEKNFVDPNISLAMVAEKFGLSEIYLSQFFKEQTGQNFFSYVENLRMNAAINLLKITDLPIKDISYKVGYNSPAVFRGAFKRYTGMSPSQYRNHIAK